MSELSYLYKKYGRVNLKEELLEIFDEESFKDLFVKARIARRWDYRDTSVYELTDNYDEFMEFASVFTYSISHGEQEIYGQILLNDNSWLEIKNYDGKEYWERIRPPQF